MLITVSEVQGIQSFDFLNDSIGELFSGSGSTNILGQNLALLVNIDNSAFNQVGESLVSHSGKHVGAREDESGWVDLVMSRKGLSTLSCANTGLNIAILRLTYACSNKENSSPKAAPGVK